MVKLNIKTLEEIKLIKKSSILASKTLGVLAKEIKPGINTLFLDKIAEEYIRSNNGIPGFLGLYGFPNTICVSINEQIVHGKPNKNILKNGDIISIDCGVFMNGYYGDVAYTFEVGEVNNDIKHLLKITKEALYIGINQCKSKNYIGDIGYHIQNYVELYGYSVIEELVGHGLGKFIHEEPQIPNYGSKGTGIQLINGMVLSIEPMVNQGSKHIIFDKKNKWNIITADNKLSCHYEQNIAIINNIPILLSTYKYIYKYLRIFSKEEDDYTKKV